MPDELAEHLDALARDDCYRVDAVLKEAPFETTQRVYFVGANGAEQGPYVRKYFDGEAGLGAAYERIGRAQRAGRRFLHLPRIIDWYDVGQRRVVVMEHVGGETLADVVYRCDPSVALAADVFPRLCEAVRELHEGFEPALIHRDLKPSNIILTRDNLTIIDFGIARSFDTEADQDTRHFGTRAYAPPEQFGYGQTDVRSDVYALGMLLYFCLVEQTPDAKARRGEFRSPQVPEALREVIVRATAFDPRDRFASVAELGCAFAAAMEKMGAPAVRMNRTRRRRITIPRWLGVAWNVLLVLFLLLFIVAACGVTVAPDVGSELATRSFAYRALGYTAILLLIFAPFLYLLRDRTSLRRIFPRMPSPRLRTEVLVVVGMTMGCIVVFIILEQIGI